KLGTSRSNQRPLLRGRRIGIGKFSQTLACQPVPACRNRTASRNRSTGCGRNSSNTIEGANLSGRRCTTDGNLLFSALLEDRLRRPSNVVQLPIAGKVMLAL